MVSWVGNEGPARAMAGLEDWSGEARVRRLHGPPQAQLRPQEDDPRLPPGCLSVGFARTARRRDLASRESGPRSLARPWNSLASRGLVRRWMDSLRVGSDIVALLARLAASRIMVTTLPG